jgi:membrane protease YdiL (CAAX protease family)
VAGPTRQSPPPARASSRPAGAGIEASTAVTTFLIAWVLAQFASFAVLGALGAAGEPTATISIPVLGTALLVTWAVYVGSMWVSSRQSGSGDFIGDYAVRFRPIDSAGLVIGALSQLVLVPLVYLPLQEFWPETFDDEKVQETAKDLVDRASGGSALLLVGLVVVGAPLVEELFYRGLLQGPLAARYNPAVVVIGVAAVFALIHFRPVEYPGLFAFGLVLGVCALRTGRLGMPIAAHVGFNAAGLVVAL